MNACVQLILTVFVGYFGIIRVAAESHFVDGRTVFTLTQSGITETEVISSSEENNWICGTMSRSGKFAVLIGGANVTLKTGALTWNGAIAIEESIRTDLIDEGLLQEPSQLARIEQPFQSPSCDISGNGEVSAWAIGKRLILCWDSSGISTQLDSDGVLSGPAFSLDGTRLAVWEWQGGVNRLRVLSVATQEWIETSWGYERPYPNEGGWVGEPIWIDNKSVLAPVRMDLAVRTPTVMAFNVETGTVTDFGAILEIGRIGSVWRSAHLDTGVVAGVDSASETWEVFLENGQWSKSGPSSELFYQVSPDEAFSARLVPTTMSVNFVRTSTGEVISGNHQSGRGFPPRWLVIE